MNTLMLLEMAASGVGDRVALGPRKHGMTYGVGEQIRPIRR